MEITYEIVRISQKARKGFEVPTPPKGDKKKPNTKTILPTKPKAKVVIPPFDPNSFISPINNNNYNNYDYDKKYRRTLYLCKECNKFLTNGARFHHIRTHKHLKNAIKYKYKK